MSRQPVSDAVPMAGAATPPFATARFTGALLVCGVLAGPLFVTVIAAQALTSDGFDPSRHPISALSLGDRGWIQIADFVLAGVLSVAFAVGLRRVLGPAPTVGPLLIAVYGVGLIVTGAFVGDPGLGFPPGTEPGIPQLSWHAAVHAVAPPVAFGALIGVCAVFTRRFLDRGRRGWASYSGGTGVAALALLLWPGAGGTVRTAVAVVITSAWMTAVAFDAGAELRRQRRAAGMITGDGSRPTDTG